MKINVLNKIKMKIICIALFMASLSYIDQVDALKASLSIKETDLQQQEVLS